MEPIGRKARKRPTTTEWHGWISLDGSQGSTSLHGATLAECIADAIRTASYFLARGVRQAAELVEHCAHCGGTGLVPAARRGTHKPCPDCKGEPDITRLTLPIPAECGAAAVRGMESMGWTVSRPAETPQDRPAESSPPDATPDAPDATDGQQQPQDDTPEDDSFALSPDPRPVSRPRIDRTPDAIALATLAKTDWTRRDIDRLERLSDRVETRDLQRRIEHALKDWRRIDRAPAWPKPPVPVNGDSPAPVRGGAPDACPADVDLSNHVETITGRVSDRIMGRISTEDAVCYVVPMVPAALSLPAPHRVPRPHVKRALVRLHAERRRLMSAALGGPIALPGPAPVGTDGATADGDTMPTAAQMGRGYVLLGNPGPLTTARAEPEPRITSSRPLPRNPVTIGPADDDSTIADPIVSKGDSPRPATVAVKVPVTGPRGQVSEYAVTVLDRRAGRYLVESPRGDAYEVSEHGADAGPSCSCPDWQRWSGEVSGYLCKHGKSLIACGLIDPIPPDVCPPVKGDSNPEEPTMPTEPPIPVPTDAGTPITVRFEDPRRDQFGRGEWPKSLMFYRNLRGQLVVEFSTQCNVDPPDMVICSSIGEAREMWAHFLARMQSTPYLREFVATVETPAEPPAPVSGGAPEGTAGDA